MQNRVALVQETLRRLFLQVAKTPFAPSPNHFGSFEVSGLCSRHSGSRPKLLGVILKFTGKGVTTHTPFNYHWTENYYITSRYFSPGDVIQGGVCLVTPPVLRTPQLHYINRLELILEDVM